MSMHVRKRKGGPGWLEYHVTSTKPEPPNRRFTVILAAPEGLLAPVEFGAYVWDAAYGSDEDWAYRDEQWRAAVEAITGRKVKKTTELTGNGHGVLYVEYE